MEPKRVRVEQGIFRLTEGRSISYFVQVSKRVKRGSTRLYRQGSARNLHEARQVRHRLWLELEEAARQGEAPTLAQFIPEFYRFLESHRRASTVYRQKSAIEAHLLPILGARPLVSITAEALEAIIDRVTTGKSSQTKKHIIAYCSDIFKRAVKKGLIPSNPCDRIDRPRVVRKDPAVLSEDEAKKLVAHLRLHFPVMFYHVALALHTLCRAGELRALTWADVRFDELQITINKTCDPKSGLKTCTKNSEIRKIPINPELVGILHELREQTFTAPTDAVLPHWREFSDGEQAKPLRIICRDLGLPQIRFHDLRASGITILLLKGVPLPKVMLVAGHKRISSTNIYLRVSGRDAKAATDALSFLGAPSETPKI